MRVEKMYILKTLKIRTNVLRILLSYMTQSNNLCTLPYHVIRTVLPEAGTK